MSRLLCDLSSSKFSKQMGHVGMEEDLASFDAAAAAADTGTFGGGSS
jgi:hypothetical protein